MTPRIPFVAATILLGLAAFCQQPAGVQTPKAKWLPDAQSAKGLKDDIAGRAEYYAMRHAGNGRDPQEAMRAAVVGVGRLSYWKDFTGQGPKWECIGPFGLSEAWGSSDNSGRVSSIVIDPRNTRRIYLAGAIGGVWKSEDRGKTWTPMSDFEESLSFGALALDPFDPDTIYACTGEAHGASDSRLGVGMLRSNDQGRTWELFAQEELRGTAVGQMVCSKKVRGLLMVAAGNGLWRSLDGGKSWIKMVEGGFQDITNSYREPDTYYACGGTFARGGVWKTTDAGNTWRLLSGTRAPGTFGRPQLAQCEEFPKTVYASFAVGEANGIAIYRTDDGGDTWTHLRGAVNYGGGQLWYDNFIACSPDNPKQLFGGGVTVYRTDDGGWIWRDVSRSYGDGVNTHPDFHCYRFDPHDPKTIYAGCDGGLFVSYDRGETWDSLNKGLATLQFVGMDVDPVNPHVAYGGTQDNGTSRGRGAPMWKEIFFGDGGITLVDYNRPNRVYTEYVGLTMAKSDDYGDNWVDCTNGIDRSGALFYSPFELDPNNPDILVAGSAWVWRTTDWAQSWTRISGNMGQVSAMRIARGHSEVIYAGSRWGGVWVTPNTGKDWYDINDGLPRDFVTAIEIDPRTPRTAYVTLAGFGHDHIFKTENAGGSWTSVEDNLPDAPINHILVDPNRPEDVYIATEVGVFVSNSGGGNWKRYGVGLPNSVCQRLALNRRTGYLTVATHGRSCWRVPLPGMK